MDNFFFSLVFSWKSRFFFFLIVFCLFSFLRSFSCICCLLVSFQVLGFYSSGVIYFWEDEVQVGFGSGFRIMWLGNFQFLGFYSVVQKGMWQVLGGYIFLILWIFYLWGRYSCRGLRRFFGFQFRVYCKGFSCQFLRMFLCVVFWEVVVNTVFEVFDLIKEIKLNK